MNYWNFVKWIGFFMIFTPIAALWGANFLTFISTLFDVFFEDSSNSYPDDLLPLGVWTVLWALLLALVLWLGSFCLPLSWLTEK